MNFSGWRASNPLYYLCSTSTIDNNVSPRNGRECEKKTHAINTPFFVARTLVAILHNFEVDNFFPRQRLHSCMASGYTANQPTVSIEISHIFMPSRRRKTCSSSEVPSVNRPPVSLPLASLQNRVWKMTPLQNTRTKSVAEKTCLGVSPYFTANLGGNLNT